MKMANYDVVISGYEIVEDPTLPTTVKLLHGNGLKTPLAGKVLPELVRERYAVLQLTPISLSLMGVIIPGVGRKSISILSGSTGVGEPPHFRFVTTYHIPYEAPE